LLIVAVNPSTVEAAAATTGTVPAPSAVPDSAATASVCAVCDTVTVTRLPAAGAKPVTVTVDPDIVAVPSVATRP
jgi:hypothetical protein